LAVTGRLEAYCREFKPIIAANGGHIIVKCAFQMLAKDEAVVAKLSGIASQLRNHMPDYRREMLAGMVRCTEREARGGTAAIAIA
jgi:hypothetical protein